MGWLEDLQARGQAQVAAMMEQVYASLPPEAPRAIVDQLPLQGRPEEVMIAWYMQSNHDHRPCPRWWYPTVAPSTTNTSTAVAT